jgi:hypothetical protein
MSSYSRAYSCSTRLRWNRWYCGCSTTGLCQVVAIGHSQAARMSSALHSLVPQYSALPWVIMSLIARTVSSTGVCGSGRWQ